MSPGLMRQRDIEKEHTGSQSLFGFGLGQFYWTHHSCKPKSDPYLPLSVPNSLTQFCLVDFIDVTLIGENGNSMRAEGLTRASSNALMAEVWSRFWG